MGELSAIDEAEVATHKAASDCWIIIHGKVYDVTRFLPDHPGGEDALLQVAGKDATLDFEDVGHSDNAREQMADFLVGTVHGYESESVPERMDRPPPAAATRVQHQAQGSEPGVFLKFVVPLLILGLAFALRFFTKKEDVKH